MAGWPCLLVVIVRALLTDSVSDYNSGTCSVFGGLGATFDPSGGAYGSCHSFPSAGVVPTPGPQVGPQVAPTQPPPPEAYNSLSKFTNSTTSLVSASFPYSGGVAAAPSATATVPTVNCSYPQSNFCMTAVHDNTNGTVFGQYHEGGTMTQSLFKAGAVNECGGGGTGGDFQPNFEALSSPASTDKAGRYLATPSLLGPSKEMCGGSGGMVGYTAEASASNQCPIEVSDTGYNKMAAAVSDSGGGSSSCSSSTSLHHTTNTTPATTSNTNATTNINTEDAPPELRLTHHHHHLHHQQLPVSSAPQVVPSLSYSDHSNPVKDTAPGGDDPTDTAENLGEIVKKSMVETVSA